MWRLRKGEETHVSALDDWRHGWPSMRRVVRDESARDRGLLQLCGHMRVTGGIGVGRMVWPRGAGEVEDALSAPTEDSVSLKRGQNLGDTHNIGQGVKQEPGGRLGWNGGQERQVRIGPGR